MEVQEMLLDKEEEEEEDERIWKTESQIRIGLDCLKFIWNKVEVTLNMAVVLAVGEPQIVQCESRERGLNEHIILGSSMISVFIPIKIQIQ